MDKAGNASESSASHRRERGIAAYAHQFSMPEAQVPAHLADLIGTVLAEEAFESAGGAAWHHPSLSPRDRSLVVLSCLITLGGVEDRLRSHIRLALDEGITPEGLEAVTSLLASYAGFPRATVATEVIRDELSTRCGSDQR